MIKAIAVDDEPLALKQLELYIRDVPFLELIASCRSAAQAKRWLEETDVLFIDINMPDLSGMDFVRALENPPLVVFTTAYSEHAIEGFKVNAVDYLLKPFSFEEFYAAAEKVRQRLEQSRAAALLHKENSHIFFKTDHHNVRVELDSISHVESLGEYIKVHIDGRDTPLLTLHSLKSLAEQLPSERFIRVHRSHIISLAHIRDASLTTVTLLDGSRIPVGEIYRQAFRKAVSL